MIKYKVFAEKEDWDKFRKGLFTASEVYKLMTSPKKRGEVLSEGAKTYIEERTALLFAPEEPDFYNSSMEHGNETEPQAVMAIAEKMGKTVNDDDFVYTSVGGFVFFWDEELNIGGTADVIIRDSHLYEVKCPKSKTHLKYMMLKTAEDVKENMKDYYTQMQVNMYLTGLPLCVFASYDDRYYDAKHHLHTIDIPYDKEFIEELKTKLTHANHYRQSIIDAMG